MQRNELRPGKELLKGLERITSVAQVGLGIVRVPVSQNGKTSSFVGCFLEHSVVGEY